MIRLLLLMMILFEMFHVWFVLVSVFNVWVSYVSHSVCNQGVWYSLVHRRSLRSLSSCVTTSTSSTTLSLSLSLLFARAISYIMRIVQYFFSLSSFLHNTFSLLWRHILSTTTTLISLLFTIRYGYISGSGIMIPSVIWTLIHTHTLTTTTNFLFLLYFSYYCWLISCAHMQCLVM